MSSDVGTTINIATSSESHPSFPENKVLAVSHQVVTLPHTNDTMSQLTQADPVEDENPKVSEVVLIDMATLTEENLDIEVDENGNLFINIPQIPKL